MRTKKLTFIMAIMLILALCFTFVACKPPVDDKDKDDASLVELVEEMVAKLQDDLTITNARRLNIDISGAATLEGLEGENPLFWKYELIAKGNIALAKDSTEIDSNFRIELNSYTKEGVKASLFSLLYEAEVNEDNEYLGSYFYLTLPGQETPLKINAVALLKLIPGADDNGAPIDIANYLGLGLMALATGAERVGEDSYKLTTNMSHVWSIIQDIVVPIITDPASLNGLIPGLPIDLSAILNEAVPVLFEGLTYKATDDAGVEVDKAVENISDLIVYIDQNLPKIDIALQFNFDGDEFSGGNVVANYAPKDAEKSTHKFTLDLYTATIGAGNYIAYDDGYSLTSEERKEMAANCNLLTFSVDGKMNFVKGGVAKAYTIAVNADVNPLVLLDGFDIAKLADIGKLSVIVTDDTTGDTVLTLYCNGADKEIIVSYKSPGSYIMINQIRIGGEFSFEALGAIIKALSPAPAELSNMSDEDAGQDVVGVIIDKVLSSLDFSQIATKGLIINDIKGLIDTIFKNIDLGLGSSTGLLIGALHATVFGGADSIEIGIKENGFKYGVCEMPNKAELVLPGNAEACDTYSELIDDTKPTSSPDIQTTYEFGESFKVTERGGSGDEAKHTFTVNGKNRADADATYSAVYYGQTGFDSTKAGTQKVSVYYGINSGLSKLLTNAILAGPLGGLSQWIPLFGAHVMTVDVTVYPKVLDENVALVIDGVTTMFTGEDIAANLNARLRYSDPNGNIREVAVTNDMISCKKPVIEDSKFLFVGKYTLDINYKGIKISQNVTVNEIAVKQNDRLEVGKTIFDQISFKMKSYSASGELQIDDIELTLERILNDEGIVIEELLDSNDKVTGLMSYSDKKIRVEMSYKFNGEQRLTYIDFDGTNISEENSITEISTRGRTIAPNTEIVDIGLGYLTYITRTFYDESGKELTYSYCIVFDKETNKLKLIPYTKVSPEWNPEDLVLSYKFTKTHSYDTSKKEFVELVTPGNEFELSANKLTLEVGQYKLRTQVGNAFSYNIIEVNPMAVFKDTTDYSTSITSGITLNIDARGFTGAGEGTQKVSIAWDATAKAYKLRLSYKEGNKTLNVFLTESEAKLTYTATMYKDNAWVAAEFATDGKFLKNAGNKYYAYKFNATITVGTEVITGEFTLNTNQGPVVQA